MVFTIVLNARNLLIPRLFVVALIAEAIPTFLEGLLQYMTIFYAILRGILQIELWKQIWPISLTRDILRPLLPLLLIYFLYTPKDLKKMYINIIVTVFAGAVVGYLAGFTIGFLSSAQLIQPFPQPNEIWFLLTSQVPVSILQSFSAIFLGFTAASIAYIRRRWSVSATE